MKNLALILVILVTLSFSLLVSNTDKFVTNSEICWEDNILNDDNAEYVLQIATDLDIPEESVTQEMFNERYESTLCGNVGK